MITIDKKEISEWIARLGKEVLLEDLRQMMLIRQFELRAESAYQEGLIGGFFHSYIGQEAIQLACVRLFGPDHWYVTSYRCHALALLLKEPAKRLMAELFGRATGNALGRGGSMHFFGPRLLGGHGIVGGQIPIGTGAAFAIKYLGKKGQIALCFFGDGAVAQGAFHESLNLASLWNLPCLYVIENNQWGMGTHVAKAISVDLLAEKKASGYEMEGFALDGMDYFACLKGFQKARESILANSRPILLEVLTERFKGHSISDPGLYRSKETLQECMRKDPLLSFQNTLIEHGILKEEERNRLEKSVKEELFEALRFTQESPWPDPETLEHGVFATYET